jgi:hypothetical protein
MAGSAALSAGPVQRFLRRLGVAMLVLALPSMPGGAHSEPGVRPTHAPAPHSSAAFEAIGLIETNAV